MFKALHIQICQYESVYWALQDTCDATPVAYKSQQLTMIHPPPTTQCDEQAGIYQVSGGRLSSYHSNTDISNTGHK